MSASVVVVGAATAPPAHAAPAFRLPFDCGSSWTATTYDSGQNLATGATWSHLNYLDFGQGGASGKTVRASADGFARLVSASEGKVEIDHGGGWTSVYQHMTGVSVTASGRPVSAGDAIGLVGSAGANTTGPHLHYAQLQSGSPVAPGFTSGSYSWSAGRTYSSDGYRFVNDRYSLNSLISDNCGPTNRAPRGSLDVVQGTPRDSIRVAGWTFDDDAPTQPLTVHVYVDGPSGTGTGHDIGLAKFERRDVGAAFPGVGDYHGFNTVITGIAPGTHSVFVYAIDAQGGDNTLLRQATVNVPATQAGSPVGNLERAEGLPGRGVRLTGWSLDQDAATTPDVVHVYYDAPADDPSRIWGGAHTADVPRGDVAASYPGAGSDHGFDLVLTGLTPGWHTAFVYGINLTGGGENPLLGQRDFYVPSGPPLGNFEYTQGLHGGAMLRGWAVDPDSPDLALGIHVYADGPAGSGPLLAGTVANFPRADVARAYPTVSPDHGFETFVSLAPGHHVLYVYALDPEGQHNPLLATREVWVPSPVPGQPLGALDLAAGSAGEIHVRGWSFDPDAPTAPNRVHLYVDGPAGGGGTMRAEVLADVSRADVASAHPAAGPLHGFDLRLRHESAGPHTVYAYGINETAPGENVFLGFAQVSVAAATAPDAPTVRGTTARSGALEVAFDPADTAATLADEFTVSCSSSDGGVTRIATGPTSPIRVAGLTATKSYRCRVRARNAVGSSGWSAWGSTVVVPVGKPAAPTMASTLPGAGSVQVGLTPGPDGGSPVTAYTATCTSTSGGTAGTTTGTARKLRVSGLSAGKGYRCRVRATNAVGAGPWSAYGEPVVVPATVPGAPAVTESLPGAGTVRVTFTAAATSGGSPVTGYTAECRSTDRGVAGTASGTARRLLVDGLTAGKTYHCRVRATNVVGDGAWSAWGAEVVVG